MRVNAIQDMSMLKPKLPQISFYGGYLYDRILPSAFPSLHSGLKEY